MQNALKAAVFAALMWVGGSAFAQGHDLPPDLVESLMTQCRPDYHRLCPDVLPGGGRVGRCLNDQQEHLSPGCLKSVKFAYAIKACLPDYRRYCNGIPPGDERIVSCLAQNYGSLLPECERIVRANEPYIDRNYPRYSEHKDNKPYDGDRYYDNKRSYDNGGYERSYRDNYSGDGRYLGRSYYNGESRDTNTVYEDDREPIK